MSRSYLDNLNKVAVHLTSPENERSLDEKLTRAMEPYKVHAFHPCAFCAHRLAEEFGEKKDCGREECPHFAIRLSKDEIPPKNEYEKLMRRVKK